MKLNFAPEHQWAYLKELTGREELAITDDDTANALRLLDGVLAGAAANALKPGNAARLSAADRDRLLASVYTPAYGPRIEGTLRCRQCEALFDTGFSLDELGMRLWGTGEEAAAGTGSTQLERVSNGLFALPDGTRFRLPTGEDECAVASLSPEQAVQVLLASCLGNGGSAVDVDDACSEAVQTAMGSLAPTLDLDLGAVCSECGELQSFHFDMQYYLLRSLLQERAQLLQQIHRLAGAYGWNLQEILALARSQRLALAKLVEAERRPSVPRGMI